VNAPVLLQGFEGLFLVTTHEGSIAHNVSEHDCG
jgi:hypothetical protein